MDRVATDGGHAVAHSHGLKVKKFEDRCEAEGMEFISLAVDTFGAGTRWPWRRSASWGVIWPGWWLGMKVTQ